MAVTPAKAYEFTRQILGREPTTAELQRSKNIDAGTFVNYLSGQSPVGTNQHVQFLKGLGFNATPQSVKQTRQSVLGQFGVGGDQRQQFVTQQQQARESFNQGQRSQQEQAIQRLQGVISAQPTLTQERQTLANELGLPGLREASGSVNQAIINLQQTLSNLPQQLENEKRGFDVTGRRMDALLRREQQPLQRELSDLGFAASNIGQQLAGAESELSQRLGLSREDFQRSLLPEQTRIQLLGDQLAREATGFDRQSETELQLLRDKIATGERLQSDEAERIFRLQLAEDEFNRQQKSQRQVVTANGRQLLINPQTGQILQDLGSSTAPDRGPSAIEQSIQQLIEQLIGGQGAGGSITNNPYVTYVPRPGGTPRPILTEAGRSAGLTAADVSAQSIWGF